MEWHIDEGSLPRQVLPQVRSLAEHLHDELKGFKHFDLRVRWRGVEDRNGAVFVVCDLKAKDSAGRDRGDEIVFLPEFFTHNDSADIRRNIREKLRRFVDTLSDIVSEDLDRIYRRLSEMIPVGGE
jgi:hypothetical protein